MEKELKSYPGVLTGHGHPTLFGRNWLNWLCPVRPALKRTHVQDFNAFSIMSRFSKLLNSIRQLFLPPNFSIVKFSLYNGVDLSKVLNFYFI